MTSRPRRRMPSARRIAEYWAGLGAPFEVDINKPTCFCCGRLRWSEWGDLERAHLVTRVAGGLDNEANLALLCHMCHSRMPTFEAYEWQKAIDWINRQTWMYEMFAFLCEYLRFSPEEATGWA